MLALTSQEGHRSNIEVTKLAAAKPVYFFSFNEIEFPPNNLQELTL